MIRECDSHGVPYTVIHTGQHYSENSDGVFFEQLELPKPDYNLAVGSGTHGKQTGEMIAGIEEILLDEEPDVPLVQGDRNSVLAGAIAADKLECELDTSRQDCVASTGTCPRSGSSLRVTRWSIRFRSTANWRAGGA